MPEMRYSPAIVCRSDSLRTWFIRRSTPDGYQFWSKPRGLWLDQWNSDHRFQRPSRFRTQDAAASEADKINRLQPAAPTPQETPR